MSNALVLSEGAVSLSELRSICQSLLPNQVIEGLSSLLSRSWIEQSRGLFLLVSPIVSEYIAGVLVQELVKELTLALRQQNISPFDLWCRFKLFSGKLEWLERSLKLALSLNFKSGPAAGVLITNFVSNLSEPSHLEILGSNLSHLDSMKL